jgi:hypothetical protein
MQIYIKAVLTAALVSCLATLPSAQVTVEETDTFVTCSTGMTKFVSTPQDFDSILIHPTCSSGNLFTTTQLAWTIEPTMESEAAVYSYPPGAVTATLENNVLVFDLNDMGEVPDKAGVVIQVPESSLFEVTVDGMMNFVRVARGFKNLRSVNCLGMNHVIQADLTESPWSRLVIDTSNSLHAVTGEDISLQMFAVSSKVHIKGSVTGGGYAGFSNEVMVDGAVRDLSITGNQNMLASSDCSSVVVDSFSSSCTIMDVMPTDIPSIPCTFPGCEKTCMSTNYGACSCTEAECDESNVDQVLNTKTTDGSTSAAASLGIWTVSLMAATVGVMAVF